MTLTDAQQEVVDADGQFLLLACPGSGKTRSAAARIARLATTPGTKVAACSYTNVGAERIGSMLGGPLGAEHFLGTVHGFLLRFVVYPFAHLAGAGRGPEIRERGAWPDVMVYGEPKQRVDLDEFRRDPDGNLVLGKPRRPVRGTAAEIIESVGEEVKRYKRALFRKTGIVSADDAMWLALAILRRQPKLARAVAARFDELLIDEAQDTSELQVACLHELAGTKALASLVLIGDLEQSIYSFQGASAAGCRALAEDDGLTTITLAENHRCSQKICDAAAHFCARAEPDKAVGPDRDCPIVPEVVLYPAGAPSVTLDTFRERLEANDIDTSDAAVLARRRTMVEALAGSTTKVDIQRLPERTARIAVALADGTLTRSDVRATERLVARVAWGKDCQLEELDDEQRASLRSAATAFLFGLPAVRGDLQQWIVAAKDALQASACLLVEKPDGHAGHVLKSSKTHRDVAAEEVFTPPPKDLVPQTVHSIKGEDRDAVLVVVRRPHGADPTKQFALFDTITSGAEIGPEIEEERRVAFVALTRARRYCLVALPDTPRGRAVAEACVGLGFAHI